MRRLWEFFGLLLPRLAALEVLEARHLRNGLPRDASATFQLQHEPFRKLAGAVVSFFLISVAPMGAVESNDVVERWNAEFLAAVKRQAPPPCLVARNLAILHLSIWRAVEGSDKGSEQAAVSGAAHEVCVALFSGDRAGFDALIKEFPKAKTKGEVADQARTEARRTLAEREGDGSNTTIHYKPNLAAGVWQRTTNNRPPETPHWGSVKPFVLKSGDVFRPSGPLALSSAAYAWDVNEVKELGGVVSVRRTKDQEEIARFWSDFSYTGSPVGRWNEIASVALKRETMTIREKARLFAMLNVAMADAGIAVWDCKYHYRFWRPISAIHETFDDGNDATTPDEKWESLLPSPSHPDYVSGHSTFSAAAALVLTQQLGVPQERIEVTNQEMPGVVRTFKNYAEIASEAGRSRIYAGIHFTSANEQGAELGRKVGEYVMKSFEAMD